jgi:hypothetical protein
MLNRKMLLGTIAAMLAGCSGQVNGPGVANGDTSPTLFAGIGGCPYPQYGCTRTNGTGVYYQEGGFAGMAPFKLMVTHFINNGSSVGFTGRYNLPGTSWWQVLASPGIVSSATYNGVYYHVQSVSETGTYPTWTLSNGSGTVHVSGASVYGLYLYLTFIDPVTGGRDIYEVWFGQMATEAGSSPSPYYPTTLYKYDLWYRNTAGGSWTPYCTDASGSYDPIVFQQGIDVAPTSGTVLKNANDVTMSCRLGAIATVYSWGYDYLADPWHYAAGIHMKRASYCGDENFYTVAGTMFQPQDDDGTQFIRFADSAIEASWTPTGASCYTQPRRDLAKVGMQPFSGWCGGTQLPTCASIGQVPSVLWSNYDNIPVFLIDGVVAQ